MIVSIADLIMFRLLKEPLIQQVSSKPVITPYGTFTGKVFRNCVDRTEHFVLTNCEDFSEKIADVRVQRQRTIVDVFGDPTQTGRRRVEYGLKLLRDAEAAVFIYLSQPENSQSLQLGLTELSQPITNLSAVTKKWAPMDPRTLGLGAQILRHLGVTKMRVHMSYPTPLRGLSGFGLQIVDCHKISMPANAPEANKKGFQHEQSVSHHNQSV